MTRNWHVVAINDTHYWNLKEEDKPYIEKMLSVYYFDKNEITYCCEITPSYFLCGLYNTAVCKLDTPEAVRERIYDRYEGEPCDDCYVHCSVADRMESKPYGEDEDEDVVREYWQGNHPY